MSETRYPYGYGTGTYTMEQLRDRYEPRMHPEYARRLFAWIEAQGGKVGIGGGWRSDGSQPDAPGYAPEGKSFHQNQQFSDGWLGYAAVDLVVAVAGGKHRAPKWSEVPEPGSDEAARWGLHCNVGGEPWHMQPTEIRGWLSWKNAGSPAPKAGYPLPTDKPDPTPPSKKTGKPMLEIHYYTDDPDKQPFAWQPGEDTKIRLGPAAVRMFQHLIANDAKSRGASDSDALKAADVQARDGGMSSFCGRVANPTAGFKVKYNKWGRRRAAFRK